MSLCTVVEVAAPLRCSRRNFTGHVLRALHVRRVSWVAAPPKNYRNLTGNCNAGFGIPLVPRSPPFASRQTRCLYLDSVDRTTTVNSMEQPAEVLQFMAEHADSDTRTFEAALRKLSHVTNSDNYKSVTSDGRFHAILSSLANRLDDCDARTLAMIADASARFRSSTNELADLALRLAETIVRREDAFTPRHLAGVAYALAVRGTRDSQAIEFIRTEAMKLMNDLEPSHCSMLLEAFRRWGVFDRQLVDLIVERMCDEIDRFDSRDVVDTLGVISRLGLARGFLLRRLCTLSFEHLQQFTTPQLVKITYSLAKLRFLTHSDIDDLLDALTPDMHNLRGNQTSEVLFALGMTDARHQIDKVRDLITHYTDKSSPMSAKSLMSLADFAWSVCSLGMVDEFPDQFKAALEEVFTRQPPQNRVPLVKLFDVVCVLELKYKALGIAVPQAWRAACDDADRLEMDKLEASRLHNEIVLRFDNLRGIAKGMKWHLRMQRNQQCGPYRVDMVDNDTKVALDVEIISWPTLRKMKHELLETLGYHPLRIEYWEWRRARTEQDQNTFLEREVSRVLGTVH